MRLYTLNNTGAVTDPETGETYQTDRDGAVDVPDALGAHLLGTHFNGEKVWEDGGERSIRLQTEDEARRRDPMTLLSEIQKITNALSDKGGDASSSDLADAAAAAQAEADRLKKQADDAAAAEAKAQEKADKEAAAAEAKAAKEAEKQAAKEAREKTAADAKAAKQKAAEEAAAAKAAKEAADGGKS